MKPGRGALKLYGISNCDKVRAARKWFASRGIEVDFHDFRKDGLSEALLRRWLRQAGWQDLINRSGTTWRSLPDSRKAAVTGEAQAIALMLEHPAVIRRPVIERESRLEIGFRPKDA